MKAAVEHDQLAVLGELVDADLLHREASPPAHLMRITGNVVAGHHRPAARRPHERARIARAIITAQAAEIREMNAWRTQWYGATSPSGGVPKG